MNDRVNHTYPYDKEGIKVTSKLDELMLQYYRVPAGEGESALHVEAFEVGQKLQYYFAVYSSAVVSQSMDGAKLTLPSLDYVVQGMESPFTLMLDNTFFQNNFQVIIAAVLNELARMNTSRSSFGQTPPLQYALTLCKWEYLSTIALLVDGTRAQKAMDEKLRVFLVEDFDKALATFKQFASEKGVK